MSYSPPLLKPASNRVFLIISCTCTVTIPCSFFPYYSWFYRLLYFIPQHVLRSLMSLDLVNHSSYRRWLSPAFMYLFQLCYNLFQDEGKRGQRRRTDLCHWILHFHLVLHLFLNSFQHSTAEYCSNVFTELPSVTPRPPSSASTANSESNVCKFRIVFPQLHLDKTKLSCNNHPVT